MPDETKNTDNSDTTNQTILLGVTDWDTGFDTIADLCFEGNRHEAPIMFRNSRQEYMVFAEQQEAASLGLTDIRVSATGDSIWGLLAKMGTTSAGMPDATAIQLAHEFQRTARPLATLLYGSRARGDHRADSDIDLVIVTPYRAWSGDRIGMTF